MMGGFGKAMATWAGCSSLALVLLAGCTAAKEGSEANRDRMTVPDEQVLARKALLCGDMYLAQGRVGLHADCLNSDWRPEKPPTDFARTESRYALNNHSVFLSASLDFDVYDAASTGAKRTARAYATTSKSHGSNLHAIEWSDQGSIIAWESPPFDQENDWKAKTPDACAMTNTPIIDKHHNVYLADCRYVFSYDRDGRLRFAIPLPGLNLEADTYTPTWTCPNGLLFTHTGRLVCIQSDANVVVMALGDDPHILVEAKPKQVSQVGTPQDYHPPDVPKLMSGMFRDDGLDERGQPAADMDEYLIAEGLLPNVWAAAMGDPNGPPIANNAAIIRDERQDNRSLIYFTATVAQAYDRGDPEIRDARVFRMDFIDAKNESEVRLFENPEYVGGYMVDSEGSGASPSITLDGRYLLTGDNHFQKTYKFDTRTGEPAPGWETGRNLGYYPGSKMQDLAHGLMYQTAIGDGVATTVEGRVLQKNVAYLVKADIDTGQLLSAWNYDDYFRKRFKDEIPPHPRYEVASLFNSAVTMNGGVLLVGFNIGYRLNLLPFAMVWPMRAVLVAIDPQTGEVLGQPGTLVDDSMAYPIVDADGRVYIGLTGMMSSVALGWHEQGMFGTLPPPALRPNGGIELFAAPGP